MSVIISSSRGLFPTLHLPQRCKTLPACHGFGVLGGNTLHLSPVSGFAVERIAGDHAIFIQQVQVQFVAFQTLQASSLFRVLLDRFCLANTTISGASPANVEKADSRSPHHGVAVTVGGDVTVGVRVAVGVTVAVGVAVAGFSTVISRKTGSLKLPRSSLAMTQSLR